jgi:hypothetical protein
MAVPFGINPPLQSASVPLQRDDARRSHKGSSSANDRHSMFKSRALVSVDASAKLRQCTMPRCGSCGFDELGPFAVFATFATDISCALFGVRFIWTTVRRFSGSFGVSVAGPWLRRDFIS